MINNEILKILDCYLTKYVISVTRNFKSRLLVTEIFLNLIDFHLDDVNALLTTQLILFLVSYMQTLSHIIANLTLIQKLFNSFWIKFGNDNIKRNCDLFL